MAGTASARLARTVTAVTIDTEAPSSRPSQRGTRRSPLDDVLFGIDARLVREPVPEQPAASTAPAPDAAALNLLLARICTHGLSYARFLLTHLDPNSPHTAGRRLEAAELLDLLHNMPMWLAGSPTGYGSILDALLAHARTANTRSWLRDAFALHGRPDLAGAVSA